MEARAKMPNWDVKEDIVISGISGRFPESDSMEELEHNLFGGIDMVTETSRRWKPGLFGTPKRMGILKDISHFDERFFCVHSKQAEAMDIMQKLLLECTYEAIFDAGYDCSSLKGKNIGVYLGCSEKSITGQSVPQDLITGCELPGYYPAMLANRISYSFGFTGPSMLIDTACSSTTHALNEAVQAIRSNRCEAAIVGGAHVSLNIYQTLLTAKLGFLSQDGKCKVFDSSANGYVRSETVGVVFVQKASEARRLYATILHCKVNNDGAKEEGIMFPSAKVQIQLFREVYGEINLSPDQVHYVEAHGTGTKVGNKVESKVIAEFFCKNRETPLLVGSVKSNMGHSEPASGVSSLAVAIVTTKDNTQSSTF